MYRALIRSLAWSALAVLVAFGAASAALAEAGDYVEPETTPPIVEAAPDPAPPDASAQPAKLAPAVKAAPAPTAKADTARTSDLDARLAKVGLKRGMPVLLRIFKQESQLEMWMQSGQGYKRFATYPICRWRGVLGPKLVEGDRQSPEGFYSFGQDHLVWQGRWFRAFNLNFPNTLDQALGRTGSGLLIHGACSSIGCYAMTDAIIDEMFDLIVAGLAKGQGRVQVHVFPFRMTTANLNRRGGSPWISFWRDLKPAHDLFASTRVPPRIGVCDGRYVVRPGVVGQTKTDLLRDWCTTPVLSGNADQLKQVLEARHTTAAPPAAIASYAPPSARVKLYAKLAGSGQIPKPTPLPGKPSSYGPSPVAGGKDTAVPLPDALVALPASERAALLGVRKPGQVTVYGSGGGGSGGAGPAAAPAYSCKPSLPACRHFIATNAAKAIVARKTKTRLAKR